MASNLSLIEDMCLHASVPMEEFWATWARIEAAVKADYPLATPGWQQAQAVSMLWSEFCKYK
jgi:hypothetical protein